MAERDYFLSGKELIDLGKLAAFRELVLGYLEFMEGKEYSSHGKLFRDLFIHMCLRGRLEMAQEFIEYFKKMPVIDQIGLAPTFSYCRNMARRRKDKKMLKWLEGLS